MDIDCIKPTGLESKTSGLWGLCERRHKMSDIIGLLGILVAFFIVIYFTYKGFHLAYVVVVACLVVLVTNNMPLIQTFNETIMPKVGEQAATLLPLYLFGAIFGKMFIDSGAAHSLSQFLLGLLGRDAKPQTKRIFGFICVVFMNMVFNYVGVDPFASLFTMIGIATGVMYEADIPRKYMPVMLVLGSSMGNVVPGSLAAPNILCQNILKDFGVTSWSSTIVGIFYVLFVLVASTFYINKRMAKDVKNGAKFEYGPLEPAKVDETHLPHVILTLIPLIVIPVSYALWFSQAAWVSMAVGCIAGILCYGAYIPKKDGVSRVMTIVDSMNDGVTVAGIPAIILLNFTLGYAIEAAPSFETISNFFVNMPGPSLIALSIMAIMLLGAAASASGMIIAAIAASTTFIPVLGVNAENAFRSLVMSTTVLDSLPFAGAIVAMMSITGIKYKEGYPPIAMTTMLFTFIGNILAVLLMTAFPMLP